MSIWEAQWLGPHVELEERACAHMIPKNKRVLGKPPADGKLIHYIIRDTSSPHSVLYPFLIL